MNGTLNVELMMEFVSNDQLKANFRQFSHEIGMFNLLVREKS